MFYNILQTLIKIYLLIFYKVKIHGDINLLNENLIICPNHVSYLDPLLIKDLTKRPIHFMAKKEIFKNSFINYFLNKLKAFPVDRDGNDLKALMNAVKIVKNNNLLCIFIEGTRVKTHDLENAKPGAILIAHLAKKDILPIYIKRKNLGLFDSIDIYIRDIYRLPDLDYKDKNNYKIVAKSVLETIYGEDLIEKV